MIAVFLINSFSLAFTATAKSKFKDLPTDFWAMEDIDYLAGKGIINGYTNGNFGPNDTIKRIDAARMIVRALNLDTKNRPDPRLKDIKKGTNGYDIVSAVVDEGIFQGNNGYFQPNQTLTRAQMAAVVNRAFQLKASTVKVAFKDISTKDWAYKDIQALVGNKITNGYDDNTFRPGNPITRAEFSTFMARVLKNKDLTENKTPIIEKPIEKPVEKPVNQETPNTTVSDNFEVIGIY